MTIRGSIAGPRGCGAVLNVVKQARGRLLRNALLAQGANAFTAALSVFILLLLLGAQIVDWRWLIPVPLIAAAAGAYRAWRQLPSVYRTAQIVDRRMGLADALSTAVYFAGPERHGWSPEIQRFQWERANALSQTVDVRTAIPYAFPRAAYLSGVLFLVATSLFALRYAVTRRLDLKPPLAAILKIDLGLGRHIEEAKAIPEPPPQKDSTQQENEQSASNDLTRRDGSGNQQQAAPQSGEKSKSNRDGNGKKAEDSNSRDREQTEDQSQSGDPQEQEQQQQQQNNQKSANNRQAGQNGESGRQAPQSAEAAREGGGSEGSSLMEKFRDAVHNILSRMKSSQPSAGQQQSASAGGQNQGNRQQQNKSGDQQARSGRQQQSGDGQGKSGAQQGEQAGRSDSGAQQAAATTRGDGEDSGKQSGSGIGNTDGNKEIKKAEQLAAMGKISEILGKRAANLSGEATVEVQSSNQQLRTPYSERSAGHSATGAEIGRDEVPLALQSYVEHYFEQVRKQKK